MRKPKKTNESQSVTVTHAQIAARAYELYLRRGGIDGHAMEDWLTAEREALRELAGSEPEAASKARPSGAEPAQPRAR
jgi:hypothetical protein